jgi:SAM-dependent methyltransferase
MSLDVRPPPLLDERRASSAARANRHDSPRHTIRRVTFYGRDLAHVHDVGYGDVAIAGAATLIEALRDAGIEGGLVVELGAGSGIAARALVDAGCEVLGVELSEDFIALAREHAPRARFVQGSLWDAELPECTAVASFGECLSYATDPRAGRKGLASLFARAHAALQPGGLLIFDVMTPSGARDVGWREGPGWIVCFTATEDSARRTLERRIVVFREDGDGYRRSDEVHHVVLYEPDEVGDDLVAAGFEVGRLHGYGASLPFRAGVAGFLAQKPA